MDFDTLYNKIHDAYINSDVDESVDLFLDSMVTCRNQIRKLDNIRYRESIYDILSSILYCEPSILTKEK